MPHKRQVPDTPRTPNLVPVDAGRGPWGVPGFFPVPAADGLQPTGWHVLHQPWGTNQWYSSLPISTWTEAVVRCQHLLMTYPAGTRVLYQPHYGPLPHIGPIAEID